MNKNYNNQKLSIEKQTFFSSSSNIYSEWISISEFNINGNINNFNFEDVFNSKYFRAEVLNEIVKANIDNENYLRNAFNWDNLKIDDFKSYNKKELYSFLENYLNDDECDEDYKKEFYEVFEYFKSYPIGSFKDIYLIDKDWFEEEDIKVNPREHMTYNYYLLMIWLDKDEKKLYTCEWASD